MRGWDSADSLSEHHVFRAPHPRYVTEEIIIIVIIIKREVICTFLVLLSLNSLMGSHWECTTLSQGRPLTLMTPCVGED